ncbi:MAG: hypothetical protein IPN94_16615 [Sphingobacteriales bacterium]|nr:hypothetical protein [Sphingobacteriales bacterium]
MTVTDSCSPSGTATGTVTHEVVNPTPTASAGNSSPVCVGSALNLTSTTDIGTTFAWV